MTIRPLGDRLLVRRDDGADRIGSIIVPDTAKRAHDAGEVLAVGPDVEDVSAGERIHFQKYAGAPVDGGLLIMSLDEVLAVEVEV